MYLYFWILSPNIFMSCHVQTPIFSDEFLLAFFNSIYLQSTQFKKEAKRFQRLSSNDNRLTHPS